MRKFIALSLIVMLGLSGTVSFAAKDGVKGASEQAYEHADDRAIFHRVGDWFATIGKSKREKANIKAERKIRRKTKKAEKEAGKEAKKKEKKLRKKVNKGEKNLKKKLK